MIAYLDTTPVNPASAATEDYAFVVLPRSTTGSPPLRSTAIPIEKAGMTLDGEADCTPWYKDVHVIELSEGLGYLMVAVRNWVPGATFGPDLRAKPDACKTAIVGFWAPVADPEFATGLVRGPVFLVSRYHDLSGTSYPLWLGVPSVAEDSNHGDKNIFVYYTAEASTYTLPDGTVVDSAPGASAAFVPGTRMRAFRRVDVLGAFGISSGETDVEEPSASVVEADFSGIEAALADGRAASAAAAVRGPQAGAVVMATRTLGRANLFASIAASHRFSPTSAAGELGAVPFTGTESRASGILWSVAQATNEALWDSALGRWLVPGFDRGKVRIWVASGVPFGEGDGPLAANPRGNSFLWEYYNQLHDVDAQPAWAGEQMLLFVSANLSTETATTGPYGYGIFRCAAIPDSVAAEFGIDFVVHPYDPATEGDSERDMVTAATPAGDSMPTVMRLDPDPVQLPNGDWLMFNGGTSGVALERNAATDIEVSRIWSDAWIA